jgi:hypothetical protein
VCTTLPLYHISDNLLFLSILRKIFKNTCAFARDKGKERPENEENQLLEAVVYLLRTNLLMTDKLSFQIRSENWSRLLYVEQNQYSFSY